MALIILILLQQLNDEKGSLGIGSDELGDVFDGRIGSFAELDVDVLLLNALLLLGEGL